MGDKPKLGVVFVTSGWFRDVGLQDSGSDTTAEVDRNADRIVDKLKDIVEPVFPGVLYSVEDAQAAGKTIKTAGVDGILLAPLMWCEDQIVRACLKEAGNLPIILWTGSPGNSLPDFVPFQTMLQGSGAVCTLQLSGMLKREEYRYQSIVGPFDDGQVYKRLAILSSAMAVRRKLNALRVAVLPFPCEQMSTTYVDEFRLRSLYGIELKYLVLERFRMRAREIEETAIKAFSKEIRDAAIEVQIDDSNLHEGIRYALAIEAILEEENIEVLAMNDVIDEMHDSFGLRPCLTNPRLSDSGAVISMEADVAASVAMYALRQFTGQSPLYTEVFSVDYEKNCLLLGHAGYHDSANRDPALPVKIVPDVEYENSDPFCGAATYFKYKPGPVTVVNSVWDGERLKWTAFEGESLEGPFKMEGNCHLFCRLKPEVKTFFKSAIESGVSQHWIVISGHIADDVASLCSTLEIKFEKIE